jgi:hypothetical protein
LTWSSAGAERSAVVLITDIVFGLLTLSGFAYAPELADLPDQKMWRVDRTADYGAFRDAARGRVDLAGIERHWRTGSSAPCTPEPCARTT